MLWLYLLAISWCREKNGKMMLCERVSRLRQKVIYSFTPEHSVASAGGKEGTGFGVGWGPVADTLQTQARRSMVLFVSFGQR